jgi:hypothetical protein
MLGLGSRHIKFTIRGWWQLSCRRKHIYSSDGAWHSDRRTRFQSDCGGLGEVTSGLIHTDDSQSPEAVQALGMRAGIVVNVTRADRRRLEAIVSDRSAPQKHVWRAQIILATADGCGTAEIMRRSGRAKPVVWT